MTRRSSSLNPDHGSSRRSLIMLGVIVIKPPQQSETNFPWGEDHAQRAARTGLPEIFGRKRRPIFPSYIRSRAPLDLEKLALQTSRRAAVYRSDRWTTESVSKKIARMDEAERRQYAMRGFGRVFKRHRIWWIAYSRGGKECRESSRSTKRSDALALLKKRNEERLVSGRVLLSQIFQDRLADVKLRSIGSIRHLMLYHRRFMNFFGNIVARNLGTCDIRRYQAARYQQGAAGGR